MAPYRTLEATREDVAIDGRTSREPVPEGRALESRVVGGNGWSRRAVDEDARMSYGVYLRDGARSGDERRELVPLPEGVRAGVLGGDE